MASGHCWRPPEGWVAPAVPPSNASRLMVAAKRPKGFHCSTDDDKTLKIICFKILRFFHNS